MTQIKHKLSKGLATDLDLVSVGDTKLLYSKDGKYTKVGSEYVYTNNKGSKFEFNISNGFIILGSKEYLGNIYIISHNPSTNEGEIGIYDGSYYQPLSNYSLDCVNQNSLFRTILFNFNLNFPIEIECRTEQDGSINIYFTDNYNPPRVINTFKIYCSNQFNQINLVQEAKFSIPLIKNILNGGSLKSGEYIYFYRYSNSEFVYTNWSASSKVASITASLFTNDEVLSVDQVWSDYEGSDPNAITNKRVIVEINNLDQSYKFIDLGYIWYTGTSSEVHIIRNIPISSGTIEYTHSTIDSGNESTLTPEQLNQYLTSFKRVKTMSLLENRLYFANVQYNKRHYDEFYEIVSNVIMIPTIDYDIDVYDPLVVNSHFDSNGNLDWHYRIFANTHYKESYKNPFVIRDRVGYSRGEIYPFAIPFQLLNGSWSDAYPIGKYIDFITGIEHYTNKNDIKYDPTDPNGVDNYYSGLLMFQTEFQEPLYSPPAIPVTDNIVANVLHAYFIFDQPALDAIQDLYDRKIIQNFSIVRGERVKNKLYQGLSYKPMYMGDNNGDLITGIDCGYKKFQVISNKRIMMPIENTRFVKMTDNGTPGVPDYQYYVEATECTDDSTGTPLDWTLLGSWASRVPPFKKNYIFRDNKMLGFTSPDWELPGYLNELNFKPYVVFQRLLNFDSFEKLETNIYSQNYQADDTKVFDFANQSKYWYYYHEMQSEIDKSIIVPSPITRNNIYNKIYSPYKPDSLINLLYESESLIGVNKIITTNINEKKWLYEYEQEDGPLDISFVITNPNLFTCPFIFLDSLAISGTPASDIYPTLAQYSSDDCGSVDPDDTIFKTWWHIIDLCKQDINIFFNIDYSNPLDPIYQSINYNAVVDWYSKSENIIYRFIGNLFSADIANSNYFADTSVFPILDGRKHLRDIFGGDTYICRNYKKLFQSKDCIYSTKIQWDNVNDSCNINADWFDRDYDKAHYGMVISYICESYHNPSLRNSNALQKHYDNSSNKLDYARKDYNIETRETGLYNQGYTKNIDVVRTLLGSNNYLKINANQFSESDIHYTVRVHYSELDVYDSLFDNLRMFLPNNYKDYDVRNGEINRLISQNNHLYCIQDKALFILGTRERSAVNDVSGFVLKLGVGEILEEKAIVVTTEYGSQHQWSIIQSKDGLYGVDYDRGVIWFVKEQSSIDLTRELNCKLLLQKIGNLNVSHNYSNLKITTDDILSNLKGVWDINSSPIINNGIISQYDSFNEEILFTFVTDKNPTTIVFSETFKYFSTEYSFVPRTYMKLNKRIFKLRDCVVQLNNEAVYELNKLKETHYYKNFSGDWYIKPLIELHIVQILSRLTKDESGIINSIENIPVVFDNLYLVSNELKPKQIKCENTYQNGVFDLNDMRYLERVFKSHYPRGNSKERFRDLPIKIKIYWNTELNEELKLYSVVSDVRLTYSI